MEEEPLTLEYMRVTPHSVEAEQAVLGGLMLSSQEESLSLESVERLRPGVFYRIEHQVIFKCMIQLVRANKPIDIITVSDYLKETDKLHDVGGLIYLNELAMNTPSAANIGTYADIVYERYVRRALLTTCTQVIDSCYNTKGQASADILDTAEQKMFKISQHANKSTGPEDIKDVLARSITQIETKCKNKGVISGITTGFTDFDKVTTGLNPGELIIIAGRPSMGKTSFAMNIAEYAGMKSGKCVLVFSMEMPGEDLTNRMLSSIGRVDQNKLRTGNMNDADWAKMSHAIKLLDKANIRLDASAALSPLELRARARRVAKEHDLGLIVIDYLQLMQIPGHSENRTAEISTISRSLKALAKELNVPIIALSQLNRTLENRPNKRPIMSDLRESGAIEQDADLIAMIYRDEVYNPDSPDKGTAEVIITKHRNGPIGMIRLTFVGHHTRFDNCMTSQGLSSIE